MTAASSAPILGAFRMVRAASPALYHIELSKLANQKWRSMPDSQQHGIETDKDAVMESAMSDKNEVEHGLSRVGRAFGFGTMLAFSCLVSYWIITTILAREYRVSRDNVLDGGTWAVIATIFVFRQSLARTAKAAFSRTLATFLSFALCLVYLLIFPPGILGMVIVIWISTIVLFLAGRSADAITAAITTAVIFAGAALNTGSPYLQPIIRLADTAVGIAVGIGASRLVPIFGLSPATPHIER
jgi:hypothetical protein